MEDQFFFFGFKDLRKKLKQSEKYRESVEGYNNAFGKIKKRLERNQFWRNYLHMFEVPEILLEKLILSNKESYDLHLLVTLIVSSFSSTYEFAISQKGIELKIKVKLEENSLVEKVGKLSKLSTDQIVLFYFIYMEEILRREVLASNENKKNKESYEAEKQERYKRFDQAKNTIFAYYFGDDLSIDFLECEK